MSGTTGTTFPTGLSALAPSRAVSLLGDDGTGSGLLTVAQALSQARPADMQAGGATSGQFMVYNGTNWAPQSITIFSGAYADLSGRPTLSTVAGTGAYADLTGRPTLFSGSYTDLTNKPTIPTLPTLATVATSGSYSDLLNKPTIPSAYVLPAATGTVLGGIKAGTNITIAPDGTLSAVTGGQAAGVSTFNTRSGTVTLTAGDVTAAMGFTPYDASNPNAYQSAAQVTSTLSGFSPAWTAISGKPTFATVATTGAYADLTGKPTIPSAYTLPAATGTTLGGVKPGTGLTVLGDGTLNATGTSGVSTFNGRTGTVTLVVADVTGVLGFTPYSAANPTGYQTAADVTTKLASPGPIGSSVPSTGAFTTLTLGSALPVASGGTGGTTAALARVALGAYDAANSAGYQTAANVTTTLASYTPAWGAITGKPATFTPPIATASVLGGVKAGSGVTIAGDGTLSASGGGGSTTIDVDVTYTASGAIDPTKAFVALNSSSALAMTLANGTTARVPMFIKNFGTANATVALKLDGASVTITLLPTEVAELAWGVALTTWVKIGGDSPGVPISGLPVLAVGVGGNMVPALDIDGTTDKRVAMSAMRVGVNQGELALTSGSSVATNALLGNVFTVTLGVNATLANPTGLVAGATYQWRIKQDATGGRTLAYGAAFKWPGGTAPTLSTAANAVDIISASTDGTNVYAVASKGFA